MLVKKLRDCPPIHFDSVHIESGCRGESGEVEAEVEIDVNIEAEAKAAGGIRRHGVEPPYYAPSNTAYSNLQYAPCPHCGSTEHQNPSSMRECDRKR